MNMIYVPYCSSDAWVGNTDTQKWKFHGKDIVLAVIEDLKSRGMTKTSTLFFGGGSAGCRGAMMLTDIVQNAVGTKIPVVGLFDSCLLLDIAPLNNSLSVGELHQSALKFHNSSGVLDSSCAVLHEGEEWKCMLGEYRIASLDIPYMINSYLYDRWQLNYNLWNASLSTMTSLNEQGKDYAGEFGIQTRMIMQGLPGTNISPVVSYAPGCYAHYRFEKDDFFTTRVNGFSMNSAVEYFIDMILGNQPVTTSTFIDGCDGFHCGTGCPPPDDSTQSP